MAPPAPIAVVGMSCRLSGDVSNLEDFWTLITRSRDGWTPIPEDRFSSHAFHHPNPQKKGCFNQKGGYFTKRDLSKFDAPFFQITKEEALAMDPQQRQLLECTYEALENAGFPRQSVAGKNMGVFVGGTSSDYRVGTLRDLDQVPTFDATGNHQSIQAGRISYLFDLRGPCFAVDTACSSTLHALHLAVQSIRSGESESAIVGGSSLHLQPDDSVSMSMLGIFNDQGKTFSFDHRANSGFARGEGTGCLILKPLDQAIRDNDRIRSVIRNTGVGQDGKTIGISTPNPHAQERLMRDVYARAGISPNDTGFVEAHGTGTKVGDPLEASAIHNVFGPGRTKKNPLYMGSAKSNFGHLENASGIVSVIKASLMLQKGLILPNVNFEKANPAIPLADWNIKVPTSIRPWPRGKRFISINNFGFGGSNAHAVLERAPLETSDLPPMSSQAAAKMSPKLFVFTAHDENACKRVVSGIGQYIEQHPDVFEIHMPRDMAYTLGERRTHFPWRVAVSAHSCDELANALNNPANTPKRVGTAEPKLAFVFTGQGAQWAQMGKELIDTHPVFAKTLQAASDSLEKIGAGFDLMEEILMSKEDSIINKAHISQPATTAVQIALTDLYSSWGIKPTMTIGHSSGEIVAAYAAGAISLQDAMAVAYHRGQVASSIRKRHSHLSGAMLAVGAGLEPVKKTIKLLRLSGLTVACENSPESVTVSGDSIEIDQLAAELQRQNTFARKLLVDIAYHSPHMKLVAEDYLRSIKQISPKAVSGNVTFFSSLLGKQIGGQSLGPQYWVDNLTQPVLFNDGLQELYTQGKPDIIVEIGPHAALKGPINQILKKIGQQAATDTKYFSSLMRGENATYTTEKVAGGLFTSGYPLNFATINHPDTTIRLPRVLTDLPPYQWSDHKYWCESRIAKNHRLKRFARHDLLGGLEDGYRDSEPVWRNVLSTDDVPWLNDHQMQGLTTFPLAGYLCMAVEAASQNAQLQGVVQEQMSGYRLREVHASKALILEDGAPYEMVTSLRAQAEGTRSYSKEWNEFVISSWTSGRGWLEHCRGLVSVKKQQSSVNAINKPLSNDAKTRRSQAEQLKRSIPLDKFYPELLALGAGYKSAFTLCADGRLKASETLSTSGVFLPNTSSSMASSYETPSILPTAFIDLFFQLTFPILGAGKAKMPSLFMPSAIEEFEVNGMMPTETGEQVQVVAHGVPSMKKVSPVDFIIDVWHTSREMPVVQIRGFKMTPVNSDASTIVEPRPLCFGVEWQPLHQVQHSEKEGTSNTTSTQMKNGNADNGHLVSIDDQVDQFSRGRAIRKVNHVMSNGTNGTNGTNDYSKVNGVNGNGQSYGHNNDHSNGRNSGWSKGFRGHSKVMNGSSTRQSSVSSDNSATSASSSTTSSSITTWSNGHRQTASLVGDIRDCHITLITDRSSFDPLIVSLSSLVQLHTGQRATITRLSQLNPSPSIRYICLAELDKPVLLNMQKNIFQRVHSLLLNSASVLWVTNGAYRVCKNPARNIAQGLLRTVRSETEKVAASLDLDSSSDLDAVDKANLIIDALRSSLWVSEDGKSPIDLEFSEQDGQLFVPRVVEKEDMNLKLFRETQDSSPYLQSFEQPGRRLEIVVETPGALDSLYWKDEVETPLDHDEIEIKVAATGMNFKDVVIAMGQVPSPYLGVESSGIVSRVGDKVTSLQVGDRVCATSLGAYGTYTRCLATSAAVIPADMSLEVAASVPVIYSTAYYGIVEIARMEPGQKILIHAASGGVGQAAIQLAQMIGAEIFATVGSEDKKKLITDTYSIPEDHIFYSRNTDFGPAIRAATDGRGVDVVLNSLAGDLLRESWATLAPFGHFIEIGKKDILSNTRLEMAKFDQNCSFNSIDLTLLASERPKLMNNVLVAVLDLLRGGLIRPIGPISIVGISEVESALRKLQSGKTTGKVIVSHSLLKQQVKVTHARANLSSRLFKNATYIIIGGTGGIGRALAKRLVVHGAGHIVLLSRKATLTNELHELIGFAHQNGSSITVKACDVSDQAQVNRLIRSITATLPPVRGVIHAAMVLKDMLIENMTFEAWDDVVRSKIQGAWNFHSALLHQPLDFFTMLSSVAGVVGNKGQAAYAAANTFLDALSAHRRRLGLPAASLNLAAVGDVGYLTNDSTRREEVFRTVGNSTMNEAEVLALVESSILGDLDQSCDGQCITGLDFSDPSRLPYYAADGRFASLRATAFAKASTEIEASDATELTTSQQLKLSSSVEEATDVVAAAVLGKLGSILMLPPEVMAAQQGSTSITAFGLDSLTAIELRNWIGKELQTHLQVLQILTSGMIRDLAGLILRKTSMVGVWSQGNNDS